MRLLSLFATLTHWTCCVAVLRLRLSPMWILLSSTSLFVLFCLYEEIHKVALIFWNLLAAGATCHACWTISRQDYFNEHEANRIAEALENNIESPDSPLQCRFCGYGPVLMDTGCYNMGHGQNWCPRCQVWAKYLDQGWARWGTVEVEENIYDYIFQRHMKKMKLTSQLIMCQTFVLAVLECLGVTWPYVIFLIMIIFPDCTRALHLPVPDFAAVKLPIQAAKSAAVNVEVRFHRHVNWINKDEPCCVCFEPVGKSWRSKNKRTILRCGHGFHKKCIDQWLTKKRVCPVCNSP